MKLLEMTGDATSRVIDAQSPQPGPGEVLIETARSAVCGSEMKTYRGKGMAGANTGHEAVGTVVELGAGVTGLKPGQRVGVSAVVGCGACPECEAGRYTWCRSAKSRSNMHAEQFVMPARACSLLPADLPWDAAALLTGDGMGVPWHTAKKIDRADIETVVVMGCGPIGLGNILLQAHLGRRVIGVDIVDYRVDLASSLGAAVSIKADATLVDRIMDLTDGAGADVVIDCAGQRASVANSFLAARPGRHSRLQWRIQRRDAGAQPRLQPARNLGGRLLVLLHERCAGDVCAVAGRAGCDALDHASLSAG